jgi:hypothetical protein
VSLLPRSLGVLLVEAGAAGVEVCSHPSAPDRLRHRPTELPSHVAVRLAHYKPDLLRLLRAGFAAPDPESAYVLSERLGVAQELGMSTKPGSPGWLVAVGEAIETAWKEAPKQAQKEAANRP